MGKKWFGGGGGLLFQTGLSRNNTIQLTMFLLMLYIPIIRSEIDTAITTGSLLTSDVINGSEIIEIDAIKSIIDQRINESIREEKVKLGSSPYMHVIRNIPVDNLRHQTLRYVVPALEPPYVNYVNFTEEATKDMGFGPGVVIEIMKDIAHSLNLTYVRVYSNDTRWGLPVNGTWTGAFGMLNRGEVDLIAGAAIMQYDRSKIADLTYPFQFEQTGMLIRSNMQTYDNTLLIVTEPFKWEVWGLTAASVVISGIALRVLTMALAAAGEIQYTFLESVWVFFSVFVQQGLPVQPTTWTCRVLLSLWWLSSVTLMATFTGSLVALFAVEKTNLPFKDVEGLVRNVKNGRFTLLMDINTHTRTEMIARSNTSLMQELWHEMRVNKKVQYINGLEKGVQLVRNNDAYVLLGPTVTLQNYALVDCTLKLVPHGILPAYLSIPLQKNSQYSTYFSKRIRELVERGLVNKWMNDYGSHMASQRVVKCNSTMASKGYLDLSRAQGAFWVLIAGVGAALIALFGELVWKCISLHVGQYRVAQDSKVPDVSATNTVCSRSSNGGTFPSIESSTYSPAKGTFSRRKNVLNLSVKLDSLSSMATTSNEVSSAQSDGQTPMWMEDKF